LNELWQVPIDVDSDHAAGASKVFCGEMPAGDEGSDEIPFEATRSGQKILIASPKKPEDVGST